MADGFKGWAAGSMLGPLIGSLFVTHSSWRGAFVFFGIQAAALLLVALMLPTDAPPHPGPARWPWHTLATLTAATAMIAHAGIAAGPTRAASECLLGVGLLYAAARIDRQSAIRLLPKNLLNFHRPVGAGLSMVLTLSMSTVGFWMYGPLILKILFGTNPVIAGYILAAEALAWSLATLLVAATGPYSDAWLIRIGASAICLGAAGFAAAVPAGAMAAVIACALMQGVGFGVCWPAILHRLVKSSDRSERALVSASQSTVQRIGYAVGTAAVGIAANLSGLSDGITVAAAKTAGVWIFAGFFPILALALLAAWQFTKDVSDSERVK